MFFMADNEFLMKAAWSNRNHICPQDPDDPSVYPEPWTLPDICKQSVTQKDHIQLNNLRLLLLFCSLLLIVI